MKIASLMSLRSFLALALLLMASRGVDAAILLADNFDGYANQAAFQSAWAPLGTSGALSTTQAVSTPNSINFATTAQRNERAFSESGVPSPGNIIRFSFDFFDSDAAVAPYRQYTNLQDSTAASASGQLVSMGLNNNLTSAADGGNYYMARILGLDGGAGASAYFKLNDPGAPLRSTGWHNLRVDISASNFTFYVDGVLSQTIANTATLRSYDIVRIGSGLSSTREAFVDNVRVETIIPEPATFALAGLSLVGLMAVRRKSQ